MRHRELSMLTLLSLKCRIVSIVSFCTHLSESESVQTSSSEWCWLCMDEYSTFICNTNKTFFVVAMHTTSVFLFVSKRWYAIVELHMFVAMILYKYDFTLMDPLPKPVSLHIKP